MKMYDSAIENYKIALELNPDNFTVLKSLGIVYQSINDKKNAISFYKKALEIEPDDFDILNNIKTIKKLKSS